jgi:hypothetical protein
MDSDKEVAMGSFGRPTLGWHISHPGVGRPEGVFGAFQLL